MTDIRLDGPFDGVIASHVLEHIPDDRSAMLELFRVLRPGGWALLLVPITADRTLEDPAVQTPRRRFEVFGQLDHVRRYGPDFLRRLEDVGFDVSAEYFAGRSTSRTGRATASASMTCSISA
jgi:SAM-dependent methyltransferase